MAYLGFIVILPLAVLSGWSVFAIHRWLRRGDYGREWWKAFQILTLIGSCLGIFFACFLRYQVANARIAGFPIPVGLENREKPGAPWLPSDMPAVVRAGGMITNLMSGVALCLAPIAVGAFFKENRGKLTNETQGSEVRQP